MSKDCTFAVTNTVADRLEVFNKDWLIAVQLIPLDFTNLSVMPSLQLPLWHHCIIPHWPVLAGCFPGWESPPAWTQMIPYLLGTRVHSGSCMRLPQACNFRTLFTPLFFLWALNQCFTVWNVFMRSSQSISPHLDSESRSWKAEAGETKKEVSWRRPRAAVIMSNGYSTGPWHSRWHPHTVPYVGPASVPCA